MATDADLERRIRLGEDSSLEFKAITVAGAKVRGLSRRDFADELAAISLARRLPYRRSALPTWTNQRTGRRHERLYDRVHA